MAEERRRKRKRRGGERRPKLLPGEKVEVLGIDEGFAGSWHGGIVINHEKGFRIIEYNELLSDDGCSKLVESVQVSSAVDGRARRNRKRHRGRLRPVPPVYEFKECEIRYGLCVDALVDDAWWEGVVFDREEGSAERLVFFPDLGDQHGISVDRLRLTQEWDEVIGIWKPRGEWLLVQVLKTFEEEDALPVSIREIWYDIRSTTAFLDDIGAWIFGSQLSWHKLVSELIKELIFVVQGIPEGGVTCDQLMDVSASFKHVGIPLEELSCIGSPKVIAGTHIDLSYSSSPGKCNDMDYSCEVSENVAVENSLEGFCQRSARPQLCQNSPCKKQDYSPEALSTFISEYHNRHAYLRVQFDVIRERAKAHLLAVGWKFGITVLGNKFYVSPSGKHYRSFLQACRVCKEMECMDTLNDRNCNNLICDIQGIVNVENTQRPKEKKGNGQRNPIVRTSWQSFELEPNYCPEAVELYASRSKDGNSEHKSLKATDDGNNSVRSRVKEHLRALGWKIESRRDAKALLRLRIISPEGKSFYSFHKACCHLLNKHQIKKRKFRATSSSELDSSTQSCFATRNKLQIEHSESDSGDSMLKQASGPFGKCKKSKKQKARRNFVKKSHKSSCRSKPRQLRSCKRSREVLASVPSQQGARTILSLLIDNDMVLPRQKVQYIRKRDGHVLMEGRITREGIKCRCCNKVYTLTNFEAHAGSTYRRPSANIFLEDGRSLLECQMQMVQKKNLKNVSNSPVFSHPRLKSDCSVYQSDTICSVCHDVGDLMVLCDHCPSSFHLCCVGLEAVPEGKWFCPFCCCGICGSSDFNPDTEQFTEKTILYCDQCEREYHVGCLGIRGSMLLTCPVGNWLCSKNCSEIFLHLQNHIGKSKPADREGLSWTILRSGKGKYVECDQFEVETRAEHHSKLCVALDVLHECFVSIVEPRTRSDLIADIVFNRESELNRLNFWGFYTMLLEKGDELISVATFRVYGQKVAEVPLVGTRVKYRRQGMCRLLINELEKLLSTVGVEKLVLPAVPQLLPTWTNSFGFTKITSSSRLDLVEYAILDFPDTTLCEKLLIARKHREKHKGKCNQSVERSSEISEKVDLPRDIIMSEAIEMVEPLESLPSLYIMPPPSAGKGELTEETTYLIDSTNCASVNSLPTEIKVQASPDIAQGACEENSSLVETSRTDVVDKSTDATSEFLEKSCNFVGKNACRDYSNSYKYFYRRRISAKGV